ncbi:hypothetical protein GC173_12990 [bacterium]|nr:hypothetical protein [bacterium]
MKLMHIALLCAALGIGIGCGGRSSGPGTARSEKEAITASKLPVNLLDKKLESRMASEMQSGEVREDGLMEVSVNLRNRTYKNLHVQARTVFKDSRGISTGDETQWKDLYFSPQQAQTYRSVSKTTGMDLYTVEVRLPRKPGK